MGEIAAFAGGRAVIVITSGEYCVVHALKMAARQPRAGPSLEDEFRSASEVMRNAKGLRLSNEQKLTIYALFKQVNA